MDNWELSVRSLSSSFIIQAIQLRILNELSKEFVLSGQRNNNLITPKNQELASNSEVFNFNSYNSHLNGVTEGTGMSIIRSSFYSKI